MLRHSTIYSFRSQLWASATGKPNSRSLPKTTDTPCYQGISTGAKDRRHTPLDLHHQRVPALFDGIDSHRPSCPPYAALPHLSNLCKMQASTTTAHCKQGISLLSRPLCLLAFIELLDCFTSSRWAPGCLPSRSPWKEAGRCWRHGEAAVGTAVGHHHPHCTELRPLSVPHHYLITPLSDHTTIRTTPLSVSHNNPYYTTPRCTHPLHPHAPSQLLLFVVFLRHPVVCATPA